MSNLANPFETLSSLEGHSGVKYYSLASLEKKGVGLISRLPVAIRVMLESVLRHCDGKKIFEENVKKLARWNEHRGKQTEHAGEIPFVVSRVILQDFTGVPLLVDLAAMRDAIAHQGLNPERIEPTVPVDLVIDHSVQVDRSGTKDAFLFNLEIEFERNQERYAFLKWGSQAFKTLKIVPPGIGIVHQVNLELIASVVAQKKVNGEILCFPDTLVGTDSHTTMVNGLGVVAWGVGGIEAEAAMLGQPVFLPDPEVIGVHLKGKLRPGVTATDLTLRVTEMLRKENVVGKFVEFFGEGAASLSVADRATIGNMSPEYGATVGFFPVDEKTLDYLRMTGREESHITLVKDYLSAQGLFGIPRKGEIDYTKELELDLSGVNPCVAGPKRPQDRIDLFRLKEVFEQTLFTSVKQGGYGKEEKVFPKVCIHPEGVIPLENGDASGGKLFLDHNGDPLEMDELEMITNRPATSSKKRKGMESSSQPEEKPIVCEAIVTHGSVVIAAITSCTNTSNPSVMLGAGILAKKAVEKGLKVNRCIKTSLAPGSRVVTDYLEKAGLTSYLDQLGFQLVAYGCTTCIGNSGPLSEQIEEAIQTADLIAASVLSGNRNFEARIHSSVKANFLMSPPLVVAFAIAGRINIDMEKEPLGYGKNGDPVFLRDIWPKDEEIQEAIEQALNPLQFKKRYSHVEDDNPVWKAIQIGKGLRYPWDPKSTYIQCPPYFESFKQTLSPFPSLKGMRLLAIFGDSVTTDHISPAGAFRADTAAGKYLVDLGIPASEFNSYGSRRGNHHVMMRGTFANVRIRNQLAEGKEGGWTKHFPSGALMPLFDACEIYQKEGVPLIIFAGKDYGMGSSRDWAAKGTALLGVKAVVAQSFERIHRSNLVGMGVLPLQFENGGVEALGLKGRELFSIEGLEELVPYQEAMLCISDPGGEERKVKVRVRLDTPIEVEYYRHGGILPYVLRSML